MLVKPYEGRQPVFGPDVFIAPDAVVIGDVAVGDGSSVWYGSVLRGSVLGRRADPESVSI